MRRFRNACARVPATGCLRVIKGFGWLLASCGLLGSLIAHPPHLQLWTNLVVEVTGTLFIAPVILYNWMQQATSPFPSLLLELVGLLTRSMSVVAGTFCAVTGLWPLTCCFWGAGLVTVEVRARGYVLLLPLTDNGEANQNKKAIWARLVVDGDGIDIRPYKESPGSSDEEPMSRVLVEYHENQLRALTWPENVSIDDDPDFTEILVADVAEFESPQAADGTNAES